MAELLLFPVKAWLEIHDKLIAIETKLAQIESKTQPGNCNTAQPKTNNASEQEREIDIAAFLNAFDAD